MATAETVTPAPDPEPSRRVRVCLFVLAGRRLAVDVAAAREVVVLEGFTIVPRGPAYVVGVTNLRGAILPILDIRPLLELPTHPVSPGTRVMVVAADSVQAAIVIDEVRSLPSLDEVRPIADGAGAWTELTAGWLRDEAGMIPLLHVGKILEALAARGRGE